jgi:hypothetical protein
LYWTHQAVLSETLRGRLSKRAAQAPDIRRAYRPGSGIDRRHWDADLRGCFVGGPLRGATPPSLSP